MNSISKRTFPFRIGNAILCDEVRPELHGKYTLLGVMAGDVLVPEFVNFLRVAIYIELFSKRLGHLEMEAVLSYAGQNLIKLNTNWEFKDLREPGIIASPAFPINLAIGPGKIKVDAVSEGQKFSLLTREVRLIPSPTSSSSGSTPPSA